MILQGLRIDVNVKLTNSKPLAMLNRQVKCLDSWYFQRLYGHSSGYSSYRHFLPLPRLKLNKNFILFNHISLINLRPDHFPKV